MKKSLLLVAAVLITTACLAQNIFNLFNLANNFFQLMGTEKYTEAHAYFDDSVKDKILPEELKLIWTKLSIPLGDLTEASVAQTKAQGDFFLVVMDCKFTRGEQSFQLIFNKNEKLVGFFLAPKRNVSNYKLPAYADSTRYKEVPFTLSTPGHQLAGIFTVPKTGTNYPVIVLVHGSGPSDMDETVGSTKTFKDLALGLAAQGIATVRYVKRTLVYPNDFAKAFTVKEEVLDDAVAAIAYARAQAAADKKQIFLLGHSLGGMLAPRIALAAPDLKGLILAAAPARKMSDIVLEQNKYMFEKVKDTTAKGKEVFDSAIKEIGRTRITQAGAMKPDSLIIGLPVSYWVDLNNYDQVATAKKIPQKILVIQGQNDFQVSEQDYQIWKNNLGSKTGSAFRLYPSLNHLLTEQTEKGTVAQYQTPANVSGQVIDDISNWIKQLK